MFPLYDNTPRRSFPWVNYLIIAVTIAVFLVQLGAPDMEAFILKYAFVPSHFSFFNPQSYQYVLYSIFLHGSILHIVSNLWFLRVFGDNVEDAMGHFKYLLFYLLGGIIAVFSQYLVAPHTSIPMIGASGAISAVSGAYFVYFRNSRVKTLVALLVIWTVVDLSASVVLGYWFLMQVLSSLVSLAAVDGGQGGVAFFAHVGGFAFGYLLARLTAQRAAV
ncbi:rhomboid family intramembrane serine protease [Candidatus Microgenomates bacterium]|nr:rhomboid family intramembrane serine protease [Candidatus Microgenomates bacterium]